MVEKLALGGWVLYATPDCVHCKAQLGTLGGSYPNYVLCPKGSYKGASAPAVYSCATISSYPFWVNVMTKETKTGVQGKSDLRAMAGY